MSKYGKQIILESLVKIDFFFLCFRYTSAVALKFGLISEYGTMTMRCQ